MANNNFDWNNDELAVLKSKILKQVHFSYFLRRVLIPAFTAITVSVAVLLYVVKSQHVAMIQKNITERLSSMDLLGLAKYFFVAVQKTELDTIIMLTSASLLLAFFSRRLIRETINYWTRGVAGGTITKNIR